MTFDTFPVLSTQRLHLRKITHDDAKEMLFLRGNEDIMRYIPRPRAQNEADAIGVIDMMNSKLETGELINWGITLKGDDKVVGAIGLLYIDYENRRAEVGYLLHTGLHRQGIMQEALSCVLDYGFNTLKLHSIAAVTDPDNVASEGLLLKNGFLYEGHFREDCFFQGQFLSSNHFSLLEDEYRDRLAGRIF